MNVTKQVLVLALLCGSGCDRDQCVEVTSSETVAPSRPPIMTVAPANDGWFNPVDIWGSGGLNMSADTTNEGRSAFAIDKANPGKLIIAHAGLYRVRWSQQVFTKDLQEVEFRMKAANRETTHRQTIGAGERQSLDFHQTLFIGTLGSEPFELYFRINNKKPLQLHGYAVLQVEEIVPGP
jgi:hypothetical protein